MSLIRHIQFQLWFYTQARVYNHMLKLAHWEEQFIHKEENDLLDLFS